MSRHLDNLTRLLSKMQRRYGDGDTIVLELRSEIERIRIFEPGPAPRLHWTPRDSAARDYATTLFREGGMTKAHGHSQLA